MVEDGQQPHMEGALHVVHTWMLSSLLLSLVCHELQFGTRLSPILKIFRCST